MVVQLRDPEGQALRGDGFQDRAVKLGIIIGDPFPGEHAFNRKWRRPAFRNRVISWVLVAEKRLPGTPL